MVFLTHTQNGLASISRKSWIFLILSGLATGASWRCCNRALQIGEASKVVPCNILKRGEIMRIPRGLIIITAAVLFAACGKEETEETMVITGGQEYIYAPQAGEKAQAAPFAVMSGAGEDAQRMEDVTWAILSSSAGASISQEGVVTIDDTYVAGDINGTDIIIQAVCGEDGVESATATLHVREAERVDSFDILLPDSVKKGVETDISVGNFRNQYGEPMARETPGSADVHWEFSNKNITVTDGKLLAQMMVNGEAFAAVSATLDGVTAEKRFIVHNQKSYEPGAETLDRLARAEIEILRDVDFTQERDVDPDRYAYVNEDLSGVTELIVDVSGMVNYTAGTDYQVTVRHGDGSVDTEDRKADADGNIRLTLQDAAAVEVSPILRFGLGKCGLGETDGYIQVAGTEKYTGEELYGFYGSVTEVAGGIALGNENSMFVMALPHGFYNIKITKQGTGRSTVRVNGASLGTNVGNPGTGGREGRTPSTYLMEDVYVEGGTARLSLGEKDFTLATVEVRKTPWITERRVHIYIGGDSTVSNYYPIEESEPEPGRFQTGWGQVFAQYVTEENVVTNIAGGGTYAKSWYEMAFPGVVQNGQPGDYFIIQAGINDRTYSSKEEMVQYLTYMIDECREKGIIVILATAMQSPKFWKDANGNELGEYGVPEGGGLAGFMDAIRQLAEDKGVFLVDTGKLTAEWYSRVGRTYVAQNYHLYNQETGVEEDTLHLSYHGALKVAELIASYLAGQQEINAADGIGNGLEGLSFNEMAMYEVIHKDSTGKEAAVSVTGVQAVYRRYGE